ncbi:glycosyltransferase family 87 protein [Halovenus marina]|uniref:glycosyltransferase family 87 protein n=1 Tax=Halovenus marina TaxID=3396621 RepID=UPI003F57E13D
MSLSRQLWNRRHDRPGFVALSIVTVLTMVCWPVVDAWLQTVEAIHVSDYGFNDFSAYSSAVEGWLQDEEIYVQNESGGYHGSYLYPPFVIPLFYPFAKLGFEAGPVLFGVLSLVLLWVGVEAVVEELGYGLTVPERILTLFALFGFHPQLWDFKWSQISTLLAALLCFGFYTHERGDRGLWGRQWLSGLLTTFGSSVKIFYATAGAHLLRDRNRLVSALVTAGGLLAVSLLVFGIDTNLAYLDVLRWGKGWGTEQFAPYMNLTAYYRPFYLVDQFVASFGLSLPNVWVIPVTVLGVVGVVWLAVTRRHHPKAAWPTFALGVAVIPLFAPRAYTHDLVVLIVPAIILLAAEFDREDGLPWIPVLAVLLVHFHSIGTKTAIYLFGRSEAVLLQPGVYGTALLVGLAAVRLAQHPGSLPGEDLLESDDQSS